MIIWWITIETQSALYLALSVTLGFGTQVALTPLTGVLVDRWSRRQLIAIVDLLQAIVTFGLIYLFFTGNVIIWYVLLILSIRGALQAFHLPAVQAIIPVLVPRSKLSRMNGLDYFMNGLILLIGPILAVLLLTNWEIYEILWVDVLTFMIAVIPLLLITIPSIKHKASVVKEKVSFQREFMEGLRFIKKTPGLLTMLMVFSITNFFMPAVFILLPLWVTVVHNAGVEQLAFLMALQQVGMIPGAALMTVWKGFNRKVVGVVIGILLGYVGLLLITLAPIGSFWVMGIGMVLVGLTVPISNVSSQTIWQSVVPLNLQGRVFSVRVTIAQASLPIATLISGILADIIGLKLLFLIFIVLGLVSIAYSWFMTSLPQIEQALTNNNLDLIITPEK